MIVTGLALGLIGFAVWRVDRKRSATA